MRLWSGPILTVAVCAILIASASIADQRPKPYQRHSVIVAKRIPNVTGVRKQLEMLPGVERAFVNSKARKVILKLKPNSTSSALEIWELAEILGLEPVRLLTAQGIYTSKPVPDPKPKTTVRKKGQNSTQ